MTNNTFNQWISKNDTLLNLYHTDKDAFVISVKDCIETKDFPTTGGTKALAGYRGNRDAAVIDNLRKAGAQIAGKNNLHELCFGITSNNAYMGAVKNPHNPRHIPGGSSGGTAVAIATNQVRAGVGTDTGGSSRIPAAFCGIYGFRPSTGRYDSSGLIPISITRDTPGPMAQNLDDICWMDGVMAGKNSTPRNAHEAFSMPQVDSVRLGVPDKESLGVMDKGVESLYKQALEKLESAGITLVSVSLSAIQDVLWHINFPIVLYEVLPELKNWLLDSQSGITLETLVAQVTSPDVVGVLQSIQGDGAIPNAVYDSSIGEGLPKLHALYTQLMMDNTLDAIVLPTVPVFPPKIGEDETITVQGETLPLFPTIIRNTEMASNVGAPSVSIPMGMGNNNLPAGLMLDGHPNQDKSLLKVGKLVDSILTAL